MLLEYFFNVLLCIKENTPCFVKNIIFPFCKKKSPQYAQCTCFSDVRVGITCLKTPLFKPWFSHFWLVSSTSSWHLVKTLVTWRNVTSLFFWNCWSILKQKEMHVIEYWFTFFYNLVFLLWNRNIKRRNNDVSKKNRSKSPPL